MNDVASQPFVTMPSQAVERGESRPAKRAAMGGFVDSDDEDDGGAEGHTPAATPATSAETTLSATDTEPAAGGPATDDTQMHDAQMPSQEAEQEESEEDRYGLLFSATSQATADPLPVTAPLPTIQSSMVVKTCDGGAVYVRQRSTPRVAVPYEAMAAQRSKTKEGRAQRHFYGIAIHELVDGARAEMATQEAEAAKRKTADAATAGAAPRVATSAAVGAAAGTFRNGTTSRDQKPRKSRRSMLWTEKYRARSFMDLVGDDLTNRLVLRWLKRWDPVVFPGARKRVPLVKSSVASAAAGAGGGDEKPHRKILILTGPPGLGKTTLAHVCARQAGYEVLEINASDDRSRDVVQGRIRTSLGTESVKAVEQTTSTAATAAAADKKAKVARPVCVIVDEVDGVVSGSGSGGEGGFVRALIDLVQLDQKNSGGSSHAQAASTTRRRRKGDDFRQMRPLILICNDIYHASLRPLRLSGLAEIVHVGKPSVEAVVSRLATIFDKEGIPCEKEAARKLCEAAWGMATGAEAARRGAESTAEGDLRGVLVVGEWVARRLRAEAESAAERPRPFLTRSWIAQNILPDLAAGGAGGGIGARGLGRGGVREIVTRIFQEGAGFPKVAGGPSTAHVSTTSASAAATSAETAYRHEQPREQMGFAEHQQRYAMGRLREMVETSGDVDRIMTDIFAEYPNREFNDDSYLSKPDAAYEWMHFHDACAHRVFGSRDWELAPYTSQPVLACHRLFATSRRHAPAPAGAEDAATAPSPFSGPRADFLAREAEKHNRAALQTIQAQLPPSLLRAFRNVEDLAADFLPYVVRLVSPDVKPVLVPVASGARDGKASGPTSVASVRREGERVLVRRAAEVLAELGIRLQRGLLEEAAGAAVALPAGRPQWVYRMEPDLDMLASFETAGHLVLAGGVAPTRYAVRQVLDQELRKTLAARDNAARQARLGAPCLLEQDHAATENKGRGPRKRTAAAADLENDRPVSVRRDFFGRIIATDVATASAGHVLREVDGNASHVRSDDKGGERSSSKATGQKVWVSFHEGLNNAVRKPISVDDFLRGL